MQRTLRGEMWLAAAAAMAALWAAGPLLADDEPDTVPPPPPVKTARGVVKTKPRAARPAVPVATGEIELAQSSDPPVKSSSRGPASGPSAKPLPAGAPPARFAAGDGPDDPPAARPAAGGGNGAQAPSQPATKNAKTPQRPAAGGAGGAVPAALQAGQAQPGAPQPPAQGGAAGQNPPANPPAGPAAGPAPNPGAAINQPAVITPRVGEKGKKVYISEGKIPLLEFLKFLSDFTGLPLLHDSTDQNIATKEIQIANDIKEADEEVVKAILEVNRFRVFKETLPSGKEVLKVESMQVVQQSQEDAKENKVLDFRYGKPTVQVAPDEFATMVFDLKYTAPRDASEALNNLINKAGGGGAPGAAAAVRGTKSFSMVEVKNTMMLIITAKFGLLNYIKKLLELIDVPLQEPERIIHMIDVQEADPDELVSIINEFLQGQGQGRGGVGGRTTGARPRPGARLPGQATPTPTPSTPGTTGTTGQNEYRTNLIADARTSKIIVETYSEQDLQDILMLVNELDVRFDLRRLKTHIYQVRYLKAVEVAGDLQALLQGGGAGGLQGLRRGAGGTTGTRTTGTAATRRPTLTRPAGTTPGVTGQPGASPNAQQPSLIVPHEPTNSLLIQAEPEEFDEILNILSKIDTKRRQVFLEAALVQVQSQSNLNYTIELLAGNPDDRATRALFASSFNLTGIDFQNFQRTVPDLSDPAAVPPGGLAAIMHRGKLPAIVRFFKSNNDSQILATPFVLADDNMQNSIEILETRYVVNTATVNTSTTSSQQGEPAGITLSLTPTISGSEKAVFLEMELDVSEFQEASVAQATLPPKNENKMTSSVTIPDGDVFVVGGLTRQNKSKAVSKVPILGDIPIIGKLFRSESTVQNRNNLYVFLQAHILTDEDFMDGKNLTEQAQKKMEAFDPSLKPIQFDKPEVPKRPLRGDEDAERTFHTNPSFHRQAAVRGQSNTRGTTFSRRDTRVSYEEGAAEGRAAPAETGGPASSRSGAAPARPAARGEGSAEKGQGAASSPRRDGWLLAPEGAVPPESDELEEK